MRPFIATVSHRLHPEREDSARPHRGIRKCFVPGIAAVDSKGKGCIGREAMRRDYIYITHGILRHLEHAGGVGLSRIRDCFIGVVSNLAQQNNFSAAWAESEGLYRSESLVPKAVKTVIRLAKVSVLEQSAHWEAQRQEDVTMAERP